MKVSMLVLFSVSPRILGLELRQDPCTGCNNELAQAYQTCMLNEKHPCTERDAEGIKVEGQGTKLDYGCCLKVEKHNTCLQCKSMDCAYKTCNRNAKYYNEYTIIERENVRDKEWDKKAMKAAGWGEAHAGGEGDTNAYARREMKAAGWGEAHAGGEGDTN